MYYCCSIRHHRSHLTIKLIHFLLISLSLQNKTVLTGENGMAAALYIIVIIETIVHADDLLCIRLILPCIHIYILFGYYPFTTGATTVGITVVASLKLCTMQYKNIIDTLISTIIVNKSYCPLY
jgi:L-cysteine desulfidase